MDNVLPIAGRETIAADTVNQLLKSGAQQLLQQAIEIEVQDFMHQFQDRLLRDVRAAVVRNGYQPERDLLTGIDPVTAKDAKLCALTVIGVDAKGHKCLVAIEDGHRESTRSWREALLKLKAAE